MAKKSKMNRYDARQLLHKINAGIIEKEFLVKITNLNSDTAVDMLTKYAYSISNITARADAESMKREIEDMSEMEIELLCRVNNISSVEEVIFELDKVSRKIFVIDAYEKLAKEEERKLCFVLDSSGEIDFVTMMEKRSIVEKRIIELNEELTAELKKIEEETYMI